jgi:hypothetical protein
LLKLWILNLKYYLRDNPDAVSNIKRLANRSLNKETYSIEPYYLMSEIIKVIKANVNPDLRDFVCKCEEKLTKSKILFN